MRTHRLRTLHISDLHEHGAGDFDAWRRHRVLGDSWSRNVDDIVADGAVDLVCFTGDIAYSGQTEQYDAVTGFLATLLDRLGLSHDRLFVIPGNHDIDRTLAVAAWAALRDKVHATEEEAFSRWLAGGSPLRGIDAVFRDDLLARQGGYRRWVRDVLGRPDLLPEHSAHGRLGYRSTIRMPDHPFDTHIIGLDSAWLAGDNYDAHRLRLTEDQIMRLCTGRDDAQLPGYRLAMVHHPLSDLADADRSRRLLAPRVDLLLRGHLHEPQPELWCDPDRSLRQFAAGCLYETDRYPNACQIITAVLDDAGRPQRYDVRFRGWSDRGELWFDDSSLYRSAPTGRLCIRLQSDPRPGTSPPRTRTFVARQRELAELGRAINGPVGPRTCVVYGMPGVGKSYLVDHFAEVHANEFGGGYFKLSLATNETRDLDALRGHLLDALKLSVGTNDAWGALSVRLQQPRSLLHLENSDSEGASALLARLVAHLDGCCIIITGRFSELGSAAGWPRIALNVFEPDESLTQLISEHRAPNDEGERQAYVRLVAALGNLPLAVHLAAGYLSAGVKPESFLRRLRAKGLDLAPNDPADPTLLADRERAIVRSTFELSLDLLAADLLAEFGAKSTAMLDGLRALGYADRDGFGPSLGAAIAGLDAESYEDLIHRARRLSLVDVPREAPDAAEIIRIHPMLAELLRSSSGRDLAISRMTNWFSDRTSVDPQMSQTQGMRWREVNDELTALVSWLPQVPDCDVFSVASKGSRYALFNGPYRAWGAHFERLARMVDADGSLLSKALWILANLSRAMGETELAWEYAQRQLKLDTERGDDEGVAQAWGIVAQLHSDRGELGEALRLHRMKELPILERLLNWRERAIAVGKIAKILEHQGHFDEALMLRRKEELPILHCLGDNREVAVSYGNIAACLQRRGDLKVALRVYRTKVVPAHSQSGEIHALAVAWGQMATILAQLGKYDEALRLQEKELSVYEKLGDQRELAVTYGAIATVYQATGRIDDAIRLRLEREVPVYERLRLGRDLVVGRANLAHAYWLRGGPVDRFEAARLLKQALESAETLGLPEAAHLRQLLVENGLGA